MSLHISKQVRQLGEQAQAELREQLSLIHI